MKRPCLAAAVLCLMTITAQAQVRAVFLLDRTGSMNNVPTTPTRCAVSQTEAKKDIDEFFGFFGGTSRVRVLEFNSAVGCRDAGVGGWHATAAAAKTAVDAATACTGATPLAQSVCHALTVARSLPASDRLLYIYSDGGHNRNVPPSPCLGTGAPATAGGKCPLDFVADPSITNYAPADSWQAKSCAAIEASPIVINVYGFGDFAFADPVPFLRSMARVAGGLMLEVQDGTRANRGPSIWLGGCRGKIGLLPRLETSGSPRIGGRVFVRAAGPAQLPKLLLLGFRRNPRPIDLTALGGPGCKIYTSIDIQHPGSLLALRIPNDRKLVGLKIYAQGAVADARQNALGLVTTNLLRLEVQR